MNPRVSVVTAVHNGGPTLEASLRSVLDQEGVDLELVVIDDGSTDETPNVLAAIARRDPRVRVRRRDHEGQTRALILGCSEAEGDLIARHDAGDVSLPGRLRKQADLFEAVPDAALVSCGTRFVGPGRERLFEVRQDSGMATALLRVGRASSLRGPSHHGATMFRRSLYETVGGYRAEFVVAQDLDLWVRLAERGEHRVVPDVLYEAAVTLSSVSQRHRRQQVAATRILARSADLRRRGLPDAATIAKAARLQLGNDGRLALARANYFIGACLQEHGDPRSVGYLRAALSAFPLHVKAALRLVLQ